MALDPREILQEGSGAAAEISAPLAGNGKQRMQRLQVGALGIAAMVLVLGFVDIITSSAEQNQVPAPEDLPPVTAEDVPPPPPRDPLAEAGVVPDLPAEPEVVPAGEPGAPLPVENSDVPPPNAAQ